jgi:hypothetical protein
VPLDQCRLAFGNGAGLVERYRAQLACRFKMRSALDEDAAPRGGGEAADDRDRRGDHQRARAGDDQQHQRLVDRHEPRPAQQERWEHRDGDCQYENSRRVDGRETFNEALCRRARGLRFFDRFDDAVERGVASRRLHAHFELAGLVDGGGKYLVAAGFVDRDALARHAGLVDGTRASRYHAIERHALAGPDAHYRLDWHVTHCGPLPATVGRAHLGLVGGERHQA